MEWCGWLLLKGAISGKDAKELEARAKGGPGPPNMHRIFPPGISTTIPGMNALNDIQCHCVSMGVSCHLVSS